MLNIPNLLSLIRVLLIPFFCVVYLNAKNQTMFLFAALILLVSALTDILDGYIARKYHKITELGKLLDPLADKLTQGAVCICLSIVNKKLTFLLALFMIKELLMVAGGLKLMKQGAVIPGSKWFGKLATTVFYIVMLVIVFFYQIPDSWLFALISIAAAFMLLAFILYIPQYITINKQTKQGK